MIDRDYLESVSIDRLAPAARAAGLAFKNGTLNKAGIIDRLCAYPSIGAACVAVLKRQDQQQAPTSSPAKPRPSFDSWADDDTPPPQAPSAPAPTLAAPAIDLSAFVKRPELEALARDTLALLKRQENTIAGLHADITALQDRRPLEIRIEQREPIRIEEQVHKDFPALLAWLQSIGRVILSGPAGTGKSRAARQAAQALGLDFHIQTPVTMTHELIGHRDAQGTFHETPLTRAYKNGGLCLCDEFDSCAPDALLVANPIFDGNGFAMLGDGQLHEQHPDFRVILNMNTQGDGANLKYTGRNPLDGATLARFGGMLHWGVDPRLEQSMASGNDQWLAVIREIRTLVEARGIETVTATTRHTMIGARLLANSFFADKRAFVLESSLKNGALVEIWPDVLRLPAVRAFLQA